MHRPKGKDRSAVMAFPRELEAWLHDTPVRSQEWALQRERAQRIAGRSKQALTAMIQESLAKIAEARSRTTAD